MSYGPWRDITGRVLTSWICVLLGTGCAKHYRPPAVPPEQLAMLTLDSRATVLDVDGLPAPRVSPGTEGFFVGPGCRKIHVKYEESYFIWGEKKARRAGLGGGLIPALANTEEHQYETLKPIRFFIPAKPGRKYWVTATFTGEEFLPRVVETAPNGDAVDAFLPDLPCKSRVQP